MSNMLQPRLVAVLDKEDEDEYNEDVQELYEAYLSESPDYFLIQLEQ